MIFAYGSPYLRFQRKKKQITSVCQTISGKWAMKTKPWLVYFLFFIFFFHIIFISAADAANKIMPLGDSITRGRPREFPMRATRFRIARRCSTSSRLPGTWLTMRYSLAPCFQASWWLILIPTMMGMMVSGPMKSSMDESARSGWRIGRLADTGETQYRPVAHRNQ